VTDPIEVAARRLVDTGALHTYACAVSDWTPLKVGSCPCEDDVAEMLTAFASEVRRQALEDACKAICEWCEARDELFRDPNPEWDWYHVDEDSDEAFDCDAARICALAEEPTK
jgi:hypothetical protein